MAKEYNIFISHSWTYSNEYERLVSLLKSDKTFAFNNYSVPKDDPVHNADNDKELYEAIKAQIAPSSVVLILAGVYSTYSKWINKEIQIAKKEFNAPKPIIAVEGLGSERNSQVVEDNANRIVKWRADSIIDAIKEVVK